MKKLTSAESFRLTFFFRIARIMSVMVTTDKCGLMLEGFEKFVAEGGGVVEHSGGLDGGGG